MTRGIVHTCYCCYCNPSFQVHIQRMSFIHVYSFPVILCIRVDSFLSDILYIIYRTFQIMFQLSYKTIFHSIYKYFNKMPLHDATYCSFHRLYPETQPAIRVTQYVVKDSQILGHNVQPVYNLFGTVHPVEQAR